MEEEAIRSALWYVNHTTHATYNATLLPTDVCILIDGYTYDELAFETAIFHYSKNRTNDRFVASLLFHEQPYVADWVRRTLKLSGVNPNSSSLADRKHYLLLILTWIGDIPCNRPSCCVGKYSCGCRVPLKL